MIEHRSYLLAVFLDATNVFPGKLYPTKIWFFCWDLQSEEGDNDTTPLKVYSSGYLVTSGTHLNLSWKLESNFQHFRKWWSCLSNFTWVYGSYVST